jgi:Tubulin like
MLRPVIMIGCGGSGQKAVRYVRDSVRRKLLHAGWEGEFPESWQFIGIDTLTSQEDPSIPALPANDYISVSLNYVTYANLAAALDAKFPIGTPGYREMMGWRPNPSQVNVPLQDGAGQLRAVGRAAGILALQNVVQKRLMTAFSACTSGGPVLSEVSQRLGVTVPPGTPVPQPLTLVVGSMAGGTGAGIMLDVIDLVRRTHTDGSFPVLVALTPDIFGNVATDQMTANSAAFVSELLSAYWDDEGTDSALVPPTVMVNTRGPHCTFMVGRRNMDGLDLGNSKNVYRAVGEALAAVTTSAKVQDTFRGFVTGNWVSHSPKNGGGYGWHENLTKGALSSFGSTTLSIGRDRFREYLSRLLHRSIVEHLADGFNQAAVSYLGAGTAKAMSGQSKITELARMHRDEFMSACQLMEKSSQRQVSDAFVSTQQLRDEFQTVTNAIKQAFPSTNLQSGAVWMQQIHAQAQSVAVASQTRAQEETSATLKSWGSDLFKTVLETCTEFAARLSIPVVMNLVDLARADVLESAALMKESAINDRASAEQARTQARSHLSAGAKGQINASNALVENTIRDISKAISLEWSARVRDQIAVTLEAVATSMLNSVYAGMQQSLGRLNSLITPQEGNPAVVSLWPKNDGVVPANFAPSPVEFYLEDHSTWPSTARELLESSLGEGRESLPIDPVQAARTLLIRGGFSKGRERTVPPLIWAATIGDSGPRWSAGQVSTVRVSDESTEMEERIDSWLQRPATHVSQFLSEGLSDYLSEMNPKTGVPVANHTQRLSMYKQKLQEALNQSRPLMEIDNSMYATVHSEELRTSLNVQGFPFGEGHPARLITEGVVQGFLKTPDKVDHIFTGGEAESVLISSFLDYPVHPSVVTSFTQPLTQSMSSINNGEKLRASFWLWRRARILENFIPLPDSLRLAAIRGFAVARSLGLCSATVDPEVNKIVDSEGVHEFPRHLLTATNANNVLPALLESMVLTFADAPTKGKAAFNAYGALISYGIGGGLSDEFQLSATLVDFLNTGNLSLNPVDPARAAKVKGPDFASRQANVLQYLDQYISQLHQLNAKPLAKTHWRNHTGSIEPTDTLLLELITDLTRGFTEVRTAVHNHSPEDGVTWS